MNTRILITGLGVVSPVGNSIQDYWTAFLTPGRFWPEPCPKLEPRHMSNRLWHPSRREGNELETWDVPTMTSRFALEAARLCLQDAGLPVGGWREIGVSMGTAMGDADGIEDSRLARRPPGQGEAFAYRVAANVAATFGLSGPNLSISTACSAGLYSIGLGVEAIRAGAAEAMLVGGAESFSRVALGCFNRLGALDGQCCRPFDKERGGTVFGEGAAVLLLESEASARRRGRGRVYGEINGHGWSCDGYHTTAPNPNGREFEIAIRRALADARLEPAAIDCIVPHGTGTELNDLVESEVLGRVFGTRMNNIPLCAVKSKIGHNGGAAGAFSCLTGALIVSKDQVPPTANVQVLDPRCGVRLPTQAALALEVRHLLVNASAFGGNNVAMILGKTDAI